MKRSILSLLWVGCVLLLGSCGLLPNSGRDRKLDEEFAQMVPVGWEAVGGTQEVNIDDDEDEESLLFYRFDSGQVGALIYDPQVATNTYEPYRLIPRYFGGQGQFGQEIIASPGIDADEIEAVEVDGELPSRELVIRGGVTHLTFAWWQGAENGYGVSQLFAPGGLGGVDWEEWEDRPAPIQSVLGFHPLEDYRARSFICRTVLYTRRNDLPGIVFDPSPQGLNFCDTVIPAHPYAPEGVVLAFLLWPRPGGAELEALLTPETTIAQLEAEMAFERLPIEWIADIAAYPTVPMSRAEVESLQDQSPDMAPTTSVCVEFAEHSNPSLRRWVVFTLRYQPPNTFQRLPDQWTLSGALREPPPMEPPPPGYCNAILGRNAP